MLDPVRSRSLRLSLRMSATSLRLAAPSLLMFLAAGFAVGLLLPAPAGIGAVQWHLLAGCVLAGFFRAVGCVIRDARNSVEGSILTQVDPSDPAFLDFLGVETPVGFCMYMAVAEQLTFGKGLDDMALTSLKAPKKCTLELFRARFGREPLTLPEDTGIWALYSALDRVEPLPSGSWLDMAVAEASDFLHKEPDELDLTGTMMAMDPVLVLPVTTFMDQLRTQLGARFKVVSLSKLKNELTLNGTFDASVAANFIKNSHGHQARKGGDLK